MIYRLVLIFSATPFLAFASIQSEACKIKENSRNKMNVIASNIANLNTTRTPEGGPYRKKDFVCIGQKCEVKETSEVLVKYEPGHPDADGNGYVSYPDIDLMHEMKSMIQAHNDFDEAEENCN